MRDKETLGSQGHAWPPADGQRQHAVATLFNRRSFVRNALAGTLITALGGQLWALGGDEEIEQMRRLKRSDGRARLPPGQKILQALKPMGGEPGDADPGQFSLRVHGAVRSPFILDYQGLLAMPQVEQGVDVHCVTGWSAMDQVFKGVRISDLAERAGVQSAARHLILESAYGYTANILLAEALAPTSMLAYRLNHRALARTNGAPVRAVIPDLYFWKSAKWITGLRFATRDEAGYWEQRGYHNHADPWREERYG